MAALDKIETQPKARLPLATENPYQILDIPAATAAIFANAQPARSESVAKHRGKLMIKAAAWMAGLGLATAGTVLFAEDILHNTETIPGQNPPAQVHSN